LFTLMSPSGLDTHIVMAAFFLAARIRDCAARRDRIGVRMTSVWLGSKVGEPTTESTRDADVTP